jgi:hypothetical protein
MTKAFKVGDRVSWNSEAGRSVARSFAWRKLIVRNNDALNIYVAIVWVLIFSIPLVARHLQRHIGRRNKVIFEKQPE